MATDPFYVPEQDGAIVYRNIDKGSHYTVSQITNAYTSKPSSKRTWVIKSIWDKPKKKLLTDQPE